MITDMTPKRFRRWWPALGWLAFVCSMIVFATMAFVPTTWTTHRPSETSHFDLETVTVVRKELVLLLNIGFFSAIAVLLGIVAITIRRGTALLSGIALSAVFLAPVAPVVGFFRQGPPWVIYSVIRDEDGETYCFAESSFLQGQTLVLGRLRSKTPWSRTYEVLVVTNGDSPRSYLRIVRPAGAEEKYGQLYLTDDGMLLGVRYKNFCFFAYDLRSGKPHDYGAVEELSPFLTIDKDAGLHEPDVANLKATIELKEKGNSTADALRKGLYHPNPRVREVSSQLLERIR